MRIISLITDAYKGRGGIAKFNRDMIEALISSSQCEKLTVFPRLGGIPETRSDKLDYKISSVGGKLHYVFFLIRNARAFGTNDLILCGHINLLPAACLLRFFGIKGPIALVVHGIEAWEKPKSVLSRLLINSVDAIISVSEFTKKRFLAWSALPEQCCHILPNCIDTETYRPGKVPEKIREKYALGGADKILLTVARLESSEKYKGIDETLEALKILTNKPGDFKYIVAGSGSDMERLRGKSEALGLSRQVIFAGEVTEEEKIGLYRASDVFVMPGRGEGFGIVYLEALACGTPAIGSSLDASQEVLGYGELGVVTDPDKPSVIAADILSVLNKGKTTQPADLQKYSKKSFKTKVIQIVSKLKKRERRTFLSELSDFAGVKIKDLIFTVSLASLGSLCELGTMVTIMPLVTLLLNGSSTVPALPFFNSLNGLLQLDSRPGFYLAFFLLTVLVLGFLKNVFMYAATLIWSKMVHSGCAQMKANIFSKYTASSKMFMDDKSVGHLQEILLGYTEKISGQIMNVHHILNHFLLLVVYTGLMFYLSASLTIASLLIYPTFYLILSFISGKIKATSRDLSAKHKDLASHAANVLNCMTFVRTQNMQAKEIDFFSEKSRLVGQFGFSIDKKIHLVPAVTDVITLAALLILVAVTGTLVSGNQSPDELSRLLVFFVVLRRSAASLSMITRVKGLLASIAGPYEEIRRILVQSEVEAAGDGRKFYALSSAIRFEKAAFSYQTETAAVLEDLNFYFEKGKITALVGLSGAGKTTIISLLLGFYRLTSGKIFFDDYGLEEYDIASIRNACAYISQDAYIFNDTIRKNLTYGINQKFLESEITEVLKKVELYHYVEALPLGLETVVGERGLKMSGGERQRLAIGRALLKKADILFLDEATSALDSHTEKIVQHALKDFASEKTVIVIAHRLNTIRNADKIIVLDKGRICEEGQLESLVKSEGFFYSLWKTQALFT